MNLSTLTCKCVCHEHDNDPVNFGGWCGPCQEAFGKLSYQRFLKEMQDQQLSEAKVDKRRPAKLDVVVANTTR